MKVGLVGCGVIGDALRRACVAKGIDIVVYDKFKDGMNDPAAILETSMVFLCLPTPTVAGKQVLNALEDTFKWLDGEKYQGAIVVRSTVLPGTTEALQDSFPHLRLAHCPEFLTAATPFEDLVKQTVILVGASDQVTRQEVTAFWREFDKKTPIETFSSPTESEMAKYIHNCFLATKVSFFNDIYELCKSVSVSYNDALRGALAVGQIGKGHTAVPGPDGELGYGGMCFPKDMNAMADLCEQSEVHAETIRGAVEGNKRRRKKPEDR